MNKEKNDYWKERLANEYWDTYNDTEYFHRELIDLYKEASDKIRQELYILASKAEKNGVISRSDVYRANHLDEMQEGLKKEIEALGGTLETKGIDTILKVGEKTVSVTSKALGAPISFNKDISLRMLQEPWKGATFSERVWANQGKLAAELNNIVTKGIMTGKSTASMAMDLDRQMNAGLSNAVRLVRTETMHHLNEINVRGMKEEGIKQVQEVVTLDERTSGECAVHDGLIWDIDKAPTLPRHPNCRCVLVPYIDVDKLADEFARREDEIILKSEIDAYRSENFKANKIEEIGKYFSKDKYYIGKLPISVEGFPSDKGVYITKYDISRILFRHGSEISENAMNNLNKSILKPQEILKIKNKGDNRIMILNSVPGDRNHFTELILVEKNDNHIIHFLMKNNIRKGKILEKHKMLFNFKN